MQATIRTTIRIREDLFEQSRRLAFKRGILSKSVYEEFEALLRRFYPDFDWSTVTAQDIVGYIKKDKKRSGPLLTMILARGVGDHYKADDVTEEEIISTFKDFLKDYPCRSHVPS